MEPGKKPLAGLRPEETEGILFTFDTHEPDVYAASAEAELFPLHCVRGEPGWELVVDADRIDPAIKLYRLAKGVFAMWEEPDLAIEPMRYTVCGVAGTEFSKSAKP